MKSLELRVPPLAVVFVTGVLMWLVDFALPSLRIELPGRLVAAIAPALLGFLSALAGVIQFRHARTTTNPMKPDSASTLVTGGIYARTRNPMYLGFVLVLLGWGAYLQSLASILLLPAFVLYMSRFQIGPEERILTELFGEAFAAYRAKVRRWL